MKCLTILTLALSLSWISHPLHADVRERFSPIRFELNEPTRISLAIYNAQGNLVRELMRAEPREAGKHIAVWDGLDRNGDAVPAGDYEWRMLKTDGLTSRFACTLGANAHPDDGWDGNVRHAWVGDHLGTGYLAIDETGLYVFPQATEAPLIALKITPDGSKRFWRRTQWYEGGAIDGAAVANSRVYLQKPNQKIRVLDANSGGDIGTFFSGLDKESPKSLDVNGQLMATCFPEAGVLRWSQSINGVEIRDVKGVKGARDAVLLDGDRESGVTLVTGPGYVIQISLADPKSFKKVLNVEDPGAIDVDHTNGDIYLVVRTETNEEVRRYDKDWNLLQTYGGKRRPDGLYNPQLFIGVNDIIADQKGGFYIAEPGSAPRRAAHFNAQTGQLIREWYGGQSFFTSLTSDPNNPRYVWGASPEYAITQYEMDYDNDSWTVRATYSMNRFGDSLFPMGGPVSIVHRDGETYVRMEAPPALLRVDENKGLIPVAIAWSVFNRGRRFQQFSGTGRDGYPKPWVAAVEAAGYTDLATAPKNFFWGDLNGNGDFEPDEFRFPDFQEKFNVIGRRAFDADWNAYFHETALGQQGIAKHPMTEWINGTIPFWDWDQLTMHATLPPMGLRKEPGAIRELCAEPDGSIYAVIQGGVLIRDHGQHEGGGWNVGSIDKARIEKFNPDGSLAFEISRHSKSTAEIGKGVLYYPMGVSLAPYKTLLVTDSVYQPGSLWTRDGLFIGTPFDHRTDDGLPAALYRSQSDDMRGSWMVPLPDGRVYWFVQNPGTWLVYEVTGWDQLQRTRGRITRPPTPKTARKQGNGLKTTYYNDIHGSNVAFSVVKPPPYFWKFGADRHTEKLPPPPYRIDFEGFFEAPTTERYGFEAMIPRDESFKLTMGDKIILEVKNGHVITDERPLLRAGSRYPIKAEYVNTAGRPQLKWLWFSFSNDKTRIPEQLLYPPSQ